MQIDLQTDLPAEGEIGYILKSYPRMSETFIANEIYLLEKLGLKLRLFSILELTDPQRHAVVDATRAPVNYLPQLTSLNEAPFLTWLRRNAPKFFSSHWRLLKARPGSYARTLLAALWLAFKHRSGSWRQPETGFIKEFLQAGYIARQVLATGTIRHLHAHFCHTATTVAMFASRLCGLPFSFTAHAKDIYVRALNPGDLLQTKLRRAKFMVTCTKANQAHLAALGVKDTPIYIIYHGLDTRQFAPRPSEAEEPAAPMLLAVGRLVEKKGFPFLIEACRLLKDRSYQFQCQLVGGAGPCARQVASLIHELGLEDTVVMRPAVTQEELRQVYQQATLFTLPCQIAENNDRDGIPNVLVEAMAVGLPVVSTNISGIPELIEHGVSGLLAPQKDARALADAIAELLDAPALRQKLGSAAREKVCRLFNAEANVLELHRLFLDCLGGDVQVILRGTVPRYRTSVPYRGRAVSGADMKKRVLFYCQSLLGIGHFIRSRELLFSLRDFEVCFLYGGEFVPGFELPAWVEVVYLPALKSDAGFQQLYVVDSPDSLPEVQARRKELLHAAFDRFAPDILLIELFPFGRKKFNFELLPLLAHARATRPAARIVCSLRDILVRRRKQALYEKEVCTLMNQYFDLLLIHADPRLQRLEETFGSVAGLNCAIRYTGYVARQPRGKPAARVGTDPFLLVSIGGGRVGHELIACVLTAETRLSMPHRLHILTGPHVPAEQFQSLQQQAAGRSHVTLQRHTTQFPAWLRQADLSISMAGYNTCMDIVSAGARALVCPFTEHENDEQTLRARKLEQLGYLSVLDPARLEPDYLAAEIVRCLDSPPPAPAVALDLQGAPRTAELLTALLVSNQ